MNTMRLLRFDGEDLSCDLSLCSLVSLDTSTGDLNLG
jgi:hypothetical protein